MKKLKGLGVILILSLIFFTSCAKKPAVPEEVEKIINLIPEDNDVVVFVDLHKAAGIEFVNNALKEERFYKKSQEIIQRTGIDPKKDIFSVAYCLKLMEKGFDSGLAIFNLKYDKDLLLEYLKQETKELKKEDDNGITIYTVKEWDYTVAEEKKHKKITAAFLDESTIIYGDENHVKAAIDVFHKKAENIFKNETLAPLIKQANTEALLWGALYYPFQKNIKQMTAQNPMLEGLEELKTGLLSLDYNNNIFTADIKVMGGDEAKIQKAAEFLNGLKAMGAMVDAKEPALGELLNAVEITSTAAYVNIFARIHEDLLNKLIEKRGKPKKR